MKTSEHVQVLVAMRDRLRPAMFRPDLHTLRHRAIIDAFDAMERGGILVSDGAGALVHADLMEPERENYPHVARVCFRLGIPLRDVSEHLNPLVWPARFYKTPSD